MQDGFNRAGKINWKTYSAGVNVTVDGYRLDAHFATGLDHLVREVGKKNTFGTKEQKSDDRSGGSPFPSSDVVGAQLLWVSSNPTVYTWNFLMHRAAQQKKHILKLQFKNCQDFLQIKFFVPLETHFRLWLFFFNWTLIEHLYNMKANQERLILNTPTACQILYGSQMLIFTFSDGGIWHRKRINIQKNHRILVGAIGVLKFCTRPFKHVSAALPCKQSLLCWR